jgi:hypothetical protein
MSTHGAQVFCSAVPVAYVHNTHVAEWASFAQAVLESAYDSTLLVGAVLARKERRRVTVLLTKLGAGMSSLFVFSCVDMCARVCGCAGVCVVCLCVRVRSLRAKGLFSLVPPSAYIVCLSSAQCMDRRLWKP